MKMIHFTKRDSGPVTAEETEHVLRLGEGIEMDFPGPKKDWVITGMLGKPFTSEGITHLYMEVASPSAQTERNCAENLFRNALTKTGKS